MDQNHHRGPVPHQQYRSQHQTINQGVLHIIQLVKRIAVNGWGLLAGAYFNLASGTLND